jgi:hypothetical protein
MGPPRKLYENPAKLIEKIRVPPCRIQDIFNKIDGILRDTPFKTSEIA